MKKIYASIVLFHNKEEDLKKVINSFLNTNLPIKLYLIDNSTNNKLNYLRNIDKRIEYIYNDANLGYGAGHNVAIRKSILENSSYHVVLNPDISFNTGVMESIVQFMEQNQQVGNLMPKIVYPNGNIQYLCKLLPTPLDLIIRRFIPIKSFKDKMNERYELRKTNYNSILNVPNLSGCFMFLRVNVLKDVGIFDENIFMYLEDVDLNRRIHAKYETIFFPTIEVIHSYAKESYVNKKLLIYHIKSAIYYFNKWGWIIDKFRKKTNNKLKKKFGL